MRRKGSLMKNSLGLVLKGRLDPSELASVYESYDIVGDVAVIRVPEILKMRTRTIAEALLQTQKHVKTVLVQVSPVEGEFRLRDLEWAAGENKTVTVHKEFGCSFRVDLQKCYFSPRLSHERMRIAKLVQPVEVVVNMFAGVGCFSTIIAKHSYPARVYSVDINPVAIVYLKENARLNRVEAKVVPLLGDAKEVIERNLQRAADRVIMPLPEKAFAYVETALSALKPGGGVIHYYDFEHSSKTENAVEKVEQKVSEKLKTLGVDFDVTLGRIVRTTGPNWHQVAIDIKVS